MGLKAVGHAFEGIRVVPNQFLRPLSFAEVVLLEDQICSCAEGKGEVPVFSAKRWDRRSN